MADLYPVYRLEVLTGPSPPTSPLLLDLLLQQLLLFQPLMPKMPVPTLLLLIDIPFTVRCCHVTLACSGLRPRHPY